jgi:hypothetical protein
MQAEIEELTYVLVISGLFPFLACFLQLPKSVTKPAVKVVKAAKAAPAKKILAPTKSSDDDDNDDESSDEEMVSVKAVPVKNGKPTADETSEEESELEEEPKVQFSTLSYDVH